MSKFQLLYNNVFTTPSPIFKLIEINQLIFKVMLVISCLGLITEQGYAQEKILAFGDSLTAGYGLDPGEGFTDELERVINTLGSSVTVINAGVSGDTSSGGLSRLEWVLDSFKNIDLVILALGANDALRGIQPKITAQNIDQMAKILKKRNIPTVIAGMLAPPNLGKVYGTKFNNIYPSTSKKYGMVLYPFLLDGVAGIIELNQTDRIHPNKKGVSIISKKMAPVIIKVLSR